MEYFNNWLIKSKKEKTKEKRKKKKKPETSGSSHEDNNSLEANNLDLSAPTSNSTPKIDDEGYIIRPKTSSQSKSIDDFYSSSDSDSEDEKEQKIRIQIKPLTNGAPISASVDELIATVGTLSLSPITQTTNRRVYTSSSNSTPENGPIKRSISATQNISKAEYDLISVFSSSVSNTSTPSDVNQQAVNNHNNDSQNKAKVATCNPTADRYAAFSGLFSEESQNSESNESTLPKSASSTILGPPLTSAIPRPASKRKTSPQLSHQSSSISRCESVSSLSSDFRMTPISVGSSRGPSPLTLGISDVVPIAVALQESVNACFKGQDENRCQVYIIGSLKLAFPAGIVQALSNNPYPAPLTFKLTNSSKIKKIYPNKELFSDYRNFELLQFTDFADQNFEINMPSLLSNIRRLYEQTPNARYFNIDILKYQIKSLNGVRSAPLQLISHWKCDHQTTNLKIDFKYNSNALSKVEPLRNVSILVTVDGGVTAMHSQPEGIWNATTNQVLWRFEQISLNSIGGGIGSIKAKFDLTTGPSNPSVIQVHFSGTDLTVSGIDFDLTSLGYRVSLVKKQIFSGRYICD